MLALLYAVFILSGAAGLIYESVWTRYLGLFVGHSAYAQVIVLVIFLGGMSLGALLVGRYSERLRQPRSTGTRSSSWRPASSVSCSTTSSSPPRGYAYASVFPAVGLRRDADGREMGDCESSSFCRSRFCSA